MRFLIALIFLSPVFAFSQEISTLSLEAKYQTYRDRFFGKGQFGPEAFIIVKDKFCPTGQCAGYNLVFHKRNPYLNSWNCMYAVASLEEPSKAQGWPNCGYCYRPDLWDLGASEPIDFTRDAGMMDPGDGTIFIGDYLAFLATEYALARRAGKSTAEQEELIFLALKAVERLDTAAERFYGFEPKLDGFFIRHDVPFDFLMPQGPADHMGKTYSLVAGCEQRMKPACDGGEVPSTPLWNAMSQDQVIGLLWGMRMVTHFVSEEAQVKDALTGELVKVNELARAHTDRILNYVSSNGWVILDPHGEGVCRGRNSNAYNWAMAKVGKLITGKRYQDFRSAIIGKMTWAMIGSFYSGEGVYGTEPRSILGIPLYGSDVNRNMMFKLSVSCGSWSREKVGLAALETGYELYDLAHAVLWEQEPYIPRERFEEILNSAPPGGPQHFTASLYWEGFKKEIEAIEGAEGWESPNRFSNPGEGRHGPSLTTEGQFSGLDFMLLFNLYRLQWPDQP